MIGRPCLLDDLAGVAGGAVSLLLGARAELRAVVRARADAVLRRLDVVRQSEFQAVAEMAETARAAQDAADVRLRALEARAAEVKGRPGGGGPGMIA